MNSYKHTFTPGDIVHYLYEYKKLVAKRKYNRIDYEVWKVFINIKVPVKVEYVYGSEKIYFYKKDNDYTENIIYDCTLKDNDFGAYIYSILEKQIEVYRINYLEYHVNPQGEENILSETAINSNSTTLNNYYTNSYADTCTAVKSNSYTNTLTFIDHASSYADLDNRVSYLEYQMNKIENEKERENNKMMKFDFGPCGKDIRLSVYGIAIKNNAGEWVSYNNKTGEIINVDIFNIENTNSFLYKMPVDPATIVAGDTVMHNGTPMFVLRAEENGSFVVVDVKAGENKAIIPTRNMFGYNFVTKIVNIMDMVAGAPSTDQPFGNMLPFMMGDKIDPMMFMLMNQQTANINPMMMYMMSNDKLDDNAKMMMNK